MVNEALLDDRDRLESSMGVAWKARHRPSVVHAPAIFPSEILPDISSFERGSWTQVVLSRWVDILVMNAKEEGVLGGPRA